MHLYYVHKHFSPPGTFGNNRSYEFCRELVNEGFKITIITSKNNFPDLKHIKSAHNFFYREIDGIRVIILNVSYSHFMNYAKRVWAFTCFTWFAYQYLKKQADIDLLYISSTPLSLGWVGIKMQKKYGIPFLFETVDL